MFAIEIQTILLTNYLSRCRKLGFECWRYQEEVTKQHTGTYTGRMKFGPTCARCRRGGRPCIPGPAMDEGLQETAAALQLSNQQLQRRIQRLETRGPAAAAAAASASTVSGDVIKELQARVASLEEKIACYEAMCDENHLDLEKLREENEELKLDNEFLRQKLMHEDTQKDTEEDHEGEI